MQSDETLRAKLNEMFAIDGAQITKTQACPVGRWVFTLCLTLLFTAIYGVCMWGASLFHGSALVFLFALLSIAFGFVLFRLWLGFVSDVLGGAFAEKTTFVRKGDERYYYSCGRYTQKFEYAQGFIAVTGKSYDKFENKSDYSPLAGRYDRALQRRSSLYVTMTPAFWYEKIAGGDYTVSDKEIRAVVSGGTVTLSCDQNGKISKIEYTGNGYDLYDSVSPIKIFDGKLPGKYRICYTFAIGAPDTIELPPIFGTAIKDYLFLPPDPDCVKIG